MSESADGPTRRAQWVIGVQNRLPMGLLILAVLLLSGLLARRLLREAPDTTLVVGAGHPGDEAFEVTEALSAVLARNDPELRLSVVETEGTVDNIARLSDRRVDFAAVQADAELPPDARLVAVLYSDVFLLAVPTDSPIEGPADLAGARIAVAAPGSAQHQSLQRLIRHYEVADQVSLVVLDDLEADRSLASGAVDAVFRVRSVFNADLQALVRGIDVRLIPIDHATTLAAADPALSVTEVPAGALRGRPAVPPRSLETLGVDRLLVAHADVDPAQVRAVADQLFTRRQELVRVSSVAAGIRLPVERAGALVPLHRGVVSWIDREEPSYLEANADYVSLLMSTLLLLGSWLWAGRSFVSRRMQRRADNHNRLLVEVLRAIDGASDIESVSEQKRRLLHLLEAVLDDVESEAISPAHFQGFALGWEAAHDALRDRERDLRPELR